VLIGVVGSVWSSPATSNVAGKLLIAFITIANMGSVTGPGAAGWTYTAESGSARLRAKTTTFGNLGNAAGMNVFANTFPYLLEIMSLKIGLFFGGLGLVGLALIYLFIPDYFSFRITLAGRTFRSTSSSSARSALASSRRPNAPVITVWTCSKMVGVIGVINPSRPEDSFPRSLGSGGQRELIRFLPDVEWLAVSLLGL
jgi:hypothetical protein